MRTGYTRQASIQTSTDTIRFNITSPSGRMYNKTYTTVINLNQRKITSQSDGTAASKYLSKVINATLKRDNWLTIRIGLKDGMPIGNHIHYFRFDNNTYCNGFKIKSYMTGPIFLGLIGTLNKKSQEDVDKYVEKCMNSVPEVLACLTNSLKFNYWHKRNHETSLLKIDTISDTEVAIQLYEGCWIPMKQTTFRSLYSAGTGRTNKYSSISPEELYFICTKEHLTDVQIKLMYAYLIQNTSDKLVTERSLELLNELPEMFPNRIKKFIIPTSDTEDHVVMVVAGKSLDWAISGSITKDRRVSVGRQNVNSYNCVSLHNFVIEYMEDSVTKTRKIDGHKAVQEALDINPEGINFVPIHSTDKLQMISFRPNNRNRLYFDEESGEGFMMMGSICIDQQESDVSLGDQFASRAMAMLNDTRSFDMVSTMRSFKNHKITERVDLNALSKLQILPYKKR